MVNINTLPNYNKIFEIDFNEDGINDILLSGSNKKSFVIHKGLKNGELSSPIKKFFYYPITDIKKLSKRKNFGSFYLFISRSSKLAGLSSFTKYGTLLLLNVHHFNSYPSGLKVADINQNGKNEALVFGNNFNGLSLLYRKNFILKEKKISSRTAFSYAQFIDLDYDGYPDIAAYNLMNQSIDFFLNDHSGNFIKSRSIELHKNISGFSVTDINNNGFSDLLFIENKTVEILLGDSVSSFNKKIDFNIGTKPDKYVIGDFNEDGLNDLAFFNKAKNSFFICFGLTDTTFTKPVLYSTGKNLQDIISSRDSLGIRLMLLSKKGFIYKLTGFNKNSMDSQNFNIMLGGKPGSVVPFSLHNSNLNGISFFDKYDNSLKILIGTANRKFNLYYKIPLYSNLNKLYVYNNKKNLIFFNYRQQGKIVNAFHFNGLLKKTVSTQIYNNSPVIDLKEKHNLKTGKNLLFILGSDSSHLFNISEFSTDSSQIINMENDTTTSFLSDSLSKTYNKGIKFCWNKFNDSTYSDCFGLDTTNNHYINVSGINRKDEGILTLRDFYKNISIGKKNRAILWNDNEILFYKNDTTAKILLKTELEKEIFKKIYFLPNSFFKGDIQYSIIYNLPKKNFYKIQYNWNNKKFSISNFIDNVKINDYFVFRFNLNDVFLIYSNAVNHEIKFVKINE